MEKTPPQKKAPLQLRQRFTQPAGVSEVNFDGHPPRQFTVELQVELPWPTRLDVTL
jgi:hypothetical protein